MIHLGTIVAEVVRCAKLSPTLRGLLGEDPPVHINHAPATRWQSWLLLRPIDDQDLEPLDLQGWAVAANLAMQLQVQAPESPTNAQLLAWYDDVSSFAEELAVNLDKSALVGMSEAVRIIDPEYGYEEQGESVAPLIDPVYRAGFVFRLRGLI